MVNALVLTDFSANGVSYQKGQVITISKAEYDQWVAKNWIGPTTDPKKKTAAWIGPTTDGK